MTTPNEGPPPLPLPVELPATGDPRPVVMVAVPYDKNVVGPFLQTFLHILSYPYIKWWPFLVPGALLPVSRSMMLRAAKDNPEVQFLVMCDSDQTLNPLTIPRLVAHNLPVVAPGIVQRNGDPIPVAYREVGQDTGGTWRYEPMIPDIIAYLSLFHADRFKAGGGDVLLPIAPDFPIDNELLAELTPEQRRGLNTPLLPVDALGGGVLVIRRDVIDALEPDASGMLCSMEGGGEDFNLCRRIRATGYGGLGTPGPKGHGLYLDRGCWAGHLTYYAKGPADLIRWSNDRMQQLTEEDAKLPPASELLQEMDAQIAAAKQNGHVPAIGGAVGTPDWLRETVLPAGVIP